MNKANGLLTVTLTKQDINSINGLINDIQSNQESIEELAFLKESEIFSHELPRRIRTIFTDFKNNEDRLGLIIDNGGSIIGKIPNSPDDYLEKANELLILTRSDIAHILFSNLLGKPFGFRTQRYGHTINTIMAKKELENVSNNSSGSMFDFQFHSEDAFHLGAPDYLGLLCMRNEECAPTTISTIDTGSIPMELKEILFEEKFLVTSNTIHKNVVETINNTRKSILFGNFNRPYFRINENTLHLNDYTGLEKSALAYCVEELHKNRIDIVLKSGNFLYIDNFKTAHRRDAYVPNYGPNVRWLKRIVTTRDLRKTSALRNNPDSPVIENII